MHNEHKTIENLITIKAGENIALISDAGTPAFQTRVFMTCVKDWHNSGMPSGATAFVPALVNSGLPNDKFVFEGFYLIKRKQTVMALAEKRDDFIRFSS
jgi:16S rRNA (cytidine1402-2'-O)-methyltransferase